MKRPAAPFEFDRPPHGAAVSPCATCPRPCLVGADRLVGFGFRCWLAGYQTGDIACWESAWDAYASALGAGRAKVAVTELSCWVRTIKASARRLIEVYPGPCAVFCRDECLAVSMIAAGQHDDSRASRASAFALLDHGDVDDVITATDSFANVLRDIEVVLSADLMARAVASVPAVHGRH